MITLIKNNVKRDFSERAAKIAQEHLGWVEFHAPARPDEIGRKTAPPAISKPIKLKEPNIVPPVVFPDIKVNDDLGSDYPGKIADAVNDDLGSAPPPATFETKKVIKRKPRKK